jgi:hypothetical protein
MTLLPQLVRQRHDRSHRLDRQARKTESGADALYAADLRPERAITRRRNDCSG